jgi:hypothetical protein
MDTVTVSGSFDGSLEDMVERCRSLDSRRSWPGSVLMSAAGSTLYYQVSMRLKAATMTDIDIEEIMSDVARTVDGGAGFTTTQRCTWPDGVATGATEYVFSPGDPHTLTFTYRYEPPPTKLVKPKQLPAFHEGMEKVCRRYLEGLTAAPARL